MQQGIGIRLGLGATAVVASVGLLAAPALADSKHSHKVLSARVIVFTLDMPAASPGSRFNVSESVECPPGFVYSTARVRFPNPPATTRVLPPGPKYDARVAALIPPSEVLLTASNLTEIATSAEFTIVCRKTSTGKTDGHKHGVKPKVETEEVVQPANTAGAHDAGCDKPNKRVPAAAGFEALSFAEKFVALFTGYPLTESQFGARSSAPPSATAAGGGSLIWVVILVNQAAEAATGELDVLWTPRKTAKARAGGSAAAAKRHSHKIKHRLGEGEFVTVPVGTQNPGQAIVPGTATLTASCKKNERALEGGLDPETSTDPALELNETSGSKRKLTAKVANHTGATSSVRLTVLCERKKTAKARG